MAKAQVLRSAMKDYNIKLNNGNLTGEFSIIFIANPPPPVIQVMGANNTRVSNSIKYHSGIGQKK